MSDDLAIGEFLDSLRSLEGLSAADVAEITGYVSGDPAGAAPLDHDNLPEWTDLTREGADKDQRNIRSLIADMRLPQKIKLAVYGNATCRSLLILEQNRLIQTAVLSNPKLQINEIEAFVKNPNMAAYALRVISDNRSWMSSYVIKAALVTNPKTPGDIALKWLRYLQKADLRKITRSKNLPQLVVINARKRLAEEQR